MRSKNCELKIKIKVIFTKNENKVSKIYFILLTLFFKGME